MLQNYNIRYTKVQFTLSVCENTILPKYKTSALRGGIGEMLLRMNCIADRDCVHCGFREECIVQRIMYAKGAIAPKSVNEGESQGYIIECSNTREIFEAGEELAFQLLLFGKNIVYFYQYLQAITMLGQYGIGKRKARFTVMGVRGIDGKPILQGNRINMSNYGYSTTGEYVSRRIQELREHFEGVILVQTPLTLKYEGKLLTHFDLKAIYKAAIRRIYMLCCFEGIEWKDVYGWQLAYEIDSSSSYQETIPRYSNHKEQKMYLNGMKGEIALKRNAEVEDDTEFLEVLLAGELLHIGKNTSFGFGKYRLR